MKTMFDMGLRPSGLFFGSPAGAALGQVRLRGASLGQYDVSQDTHDTALQRINSDAPLLNLVQGWLNAYNDQELKTLMGDYYTNFLDASSLASEKQGTVDSIRTAFSGDASSWGSVSPKDLGYLDDWALAVERMYNTIRAVDPSYLSAPVGRKTPGVTPSATGTTPSLTPSLIPSIPGTVPIKPIPATGVKTVVPAPASTILGIPTQTFAIGVVALIGVGALIYVMKD